MDGMLLLGLVFGFGFGAATAFLIAARVKKSAIEELETKLRIGLSEIVADAKREGRSNELWLFGDRLERWIPRRGRCWPPGNWPDPPPSRRPKPKAKKQYTLEAIEPLQSMDGTVRFWSSHAPYLSCVFRAEEGNERVKYRVPVQDLYEALDKLVREKGDLWIVSANYPLWEEETPNREENGNEGD